MECACFIGYYGSQCLNHICTTSRCGTHEDCVPNSTNQGFECKCADGYYRTEGGCVDYSTYICHGFCLNGGTCTVSGNQAACSCKGTGYHGTRCDSQDCPSMNSVCPLWYKCVPDPLNPGVPNCICIDNNCECPANYCKNDGRCKVERDSFGNADFICNCKPGFFGEQCDTQCDPSSCHNGGEVTFINFQAET